MPNSDSPRTDRPEPAPAGTPDDGESASAGGNTALSQTDCFEVSRISLVYRYMLLLALTLVGVLLLSLLVPMAVADSDYLVGALLAVWALALLRYWVFLLSMPYRICPEGNESLVLHSLFRRKQVNCSDIAAIRISPFYQSYVRIVTSRKKTIPVLNHVDGLHDLINRIKRVNPDLETKGC